MHEQHVKWLKVELDKARILGKTAIVLTHHAPITRNTSAPKHIGSPLSSAFASDLSNLISSPVGLWVYGHTHHSNSQNINNVPVVSNQAGYPGEGVDYSDSMVIEIS